MPNPPPIDHAIKISISREFLAIHPSIMSDEEKSRLIDDLVREVIQGGRKLERYVEASLKAMREVAKP